MTSALRTFNTSPDTDKLIGADTLSTLINLAGRQRMLSQRIILNTILYTLGHEEAQGVAQEALNLFENTHISLVEGNRELPGIFSKELEAMYFGELQAESQIRGFIQHARLALSSLGSPGSTAQIDMLGQCATPLVNLLNSITQVYEAEAKQYTQRHQKQQRELMDNIQQITKQAKIISINAKIIAARAGDAGKEFSVVASVLTNITSELDELIVIAMKNSLV